MNTAFQKLGVIKDRHKKGTGSRAPRDNRNQPRKNFSEYTRLPKYFYLCGVQPWHEGKDCPLDHPLNKKDDTLDNMKDRNEKNQIVLRKEWYSKINSINNLCLPSLNLVSKNDSNVTIADTGASGHFLTMTYNPPKNGSRQIPSPFVYLMVKNWKIHKSVIYQSPNSRLNPSRLASSLASTRLSSSPLINCAM